MSFETFIAARYLISKHKINFITIISFLSIAGITIGVAALIVVLSVFNGFGTLVTSYLLSFDPDLRIEIISAKGDKDKIIELVEKNEQVKSYSQFVQGKVLVYRANLTEVINLKGIDDEDNNVYGINESVIFGRFRLKTDTDLPGCVLGINLADKLQLLIGDTLTVVSPVGIESAIIQFSLPPSKQFILTGIYSSSNNEYDKNYIFADLSSTQKLLGYKDNIQGIDIVTNDPDDAFNIKDALVSELNEDDYSVNTWFDFHKDLYTVMQIERWAAYIILSLIIAVATFNVLGSLSMSVIEKKRDIGILTAMGAHKNSILKIFMFEGILIGFLGTAVGLILGYLVCFLQLNYNIYPLDPTQYKISSLPVELRLSDFFYISGASMLLSLTASVIPAKRAAKTDVIQAIKWE